MSKPSSSSGVQVPPNCDLTLGIICIDKSSAGTSVWRMKCDERFANPIGIIQGGFISAMADSAMGACSVSFAQKDGKKVISANAEMKISFFKPARVGSTLTCTAQVVSGGSRVTFLEATVEDDNNTIIAKATSTYIITPRQPDESQDSKPR